MPNKLQLQQSLMKNQKKKKQLILEELSTKNLAMEGMLSVKEHKLKAQERNIDIEKPIEDYLLNFSKEADMVSIGQLGDKNSGVGGFANAFT